MMLNISGLRRAMTSRTKFYTIFFRPPRQTSRTSPWPALCWGQRQDRPFRFPRDENVSFGEFLPFFGVFALRDWIGTIILKLGRFGLLAHEVFEGRVIDYWHFSDFDFSFVHVNSDRNKIIALDTYWEPLQIFKLKYTSTAQRKFHFLMQILSRCLKGIPC